MPIPITRSSMPPFDEYCAQIKDLWDSRWLTNSGSKHKELESALKAYLDIPNLTLFTNGHLALEYIFNAMKLEGEVITTPFTFASTTHAIVRTGLTPVFCDIDPLSCTIDVKKIESLITEETSAIVPVHVYGNLCDDEEISKIAEKHNLKVIYDAAHAFGATYKGKGVASFGDASMFSFHATKVFHTIEGGAIACKDDGLVSRLNALKNFGYIAGQIAHAGGNAKMNEFQAIMGLCNLRYLEAEIEKRKTAFEHYTQRLSDIPGIKLFAQQEDVKRNYAYFPVLFDGFRHSRDEIHATLKTHGVVARKYFYPLTSNFDSYAGLPGFDSSLTPVALHISNCILTLPLFADISPDEIDFICDIIINTSP